MKELLGFIKSRGSSRKRSINILKYFIPIICFTFLAPLTVKATPLAEGTLTDSSALIEPDTIFSTIVSEADAVEVFDFTITDGGGDGLDILIDQLIINRGINDTTGDWTNYIAGAELSELVDFGYKRDLTISNSGSALTDYQVLVTYRYRFFDFCR